MNFLVTLKKRVLQLLKSVSVKPLGLSNWNARPYLQVKRVSMRYPIIAPTTENSKPSVSFFLSLALIVCLFSACQNTGKSEEDAAIDSTTVDTTSQNTLPVSTEIPTATEDINSTAQSSPQKDGPAKKDQPTPVTEEKTDQEASGSKSFDDDQPAASPLKKEPAKKTAAKKDDTPKDYETVNETPKSKKKGWWSK